MAEDFRVTQALEKLRQMVTCPFCGALVSTADGYNIHVTWHDNMSQYVASVDQRLAQFSDYIINPDTGLQHQIQTRLDTITDYVIAPETGLEPRMIEAVTGLNTALAQLRDDATAAISSVRSDATAAYQGNVDAITQLRTDATNAINSLAQRVTVLEGKIPL